MSTKEITKVYTIFVNNKQYKSIHGARKSVWVREADVINVCKKVYSGLISPYCHKKENSEPFQIDIRYFEFDLVNGSKRQIIYSK